MIRISKIIVNYIFYEFFIIRININDIKEMSNEIKEILMILKKCQTKFEKTQE
jgi:hypothetical protein